MFKVLERAWQLALPTTMRPVPPQLCVLFAAHFSPHSDAGRAPLAGGVKEGAQKQLAPVADQGAPWVLGW